MLATYIKIKQTSASESPSTHIYLYPIALNSILHIGITFRSLKCRLPQPTCLFEVGEKLFKKKIPTYPNFFQQQTIIFFRPYGTFTHYSEAWHTMSCLDHCISTSDANEIINNMSVDYSLNTADHLPLYMEIASQRVPKVGIVNGVHRRLAWDKINHTTQMEYCKETDSNMQRIHIPYDALRCTDVNCKNVNHRDDICKFYDDIIAAMSSASDTVFDRCHNANRHTGDNSIPGWNIHVDQLHDAARQSFKAWVDADKPKHGFVFDEMKRSRASFKYELRFLNKTAHKPRNWPFISSKMTSW